MEFPNLDQLHLIAPLDSDGGLHMALDRWMLDQKGAFLRFYHWKRPCLSLGKNQSLEGVDREFLSSQGIDLIRRPTGGQAVLHHHELTYALSADVPPFSKSVAECTAQVVLPLVKALQTLGVEADLGPLRKFHPSGDNCFAQLSPFEVHLGGKKLIGSAQRRGRGRFLQHGAILLKIEQPWWRQLWGDQSTDRCTSLEAALGQVPLWRELAQAVQAEYEDAAGLKAEEWVITRAQWRHLESQAASYRL